MRTPNAKRGLEIRASLREHRDEINELQREINTRREEVAGLEEEYDMLGLCHLEIRWILDNERDDGSLHIIACEMEEG